MSTILDALKRVEEQLRSETGRKNRETQAHGPDDSTVPGELGVQTGEDGEAMRVYHGLVDLIGGMQDRIRAELDDLRAESRSRLEENFKMVEMLRDELRRQENALHDLQLRREADRAADCASRAEAQNEAQTRWRHFMSEIGKTVDELKREFASQREMYAEETLQRDAECEAGEVALAAAQSEIMPLKQAQAEMQQGMAQIVRTIETLKADAARVQEAVQATNVQRDDDRAAAKKAMAAWESQLVPLTQALAKDRDAIAELDQAAAALRKDFESLRKDLQMEARKRDAEREAEQAVLTALQTQDERLNQTLIKMSENLAELERAIDAVQTGLSRQEEALRAEIQQNAPARKSTEAALAGMKSGMDALNRRHDETDKALASIVRALPSIQNELKEFREAVKNEARQRTAEREAGKAALSEVMSRLDGLQQGLDGHKEIVSETLSEAMSTLRDLRKRVSACEDALSRIHRKEGVESATETETASGDASREAARFDEMRHARSPHAMDKREAQRLHAEAGEAYLKGDYAGALGILDAINAAFPNNRSILYNRAECLISLKRNDEARELCDYLANVLDHAPARELRDTIKD